MSKEISYQGLFEEFKKEYEKEIENYKKETGYWCLDRVDNFFDEKKSNILTYLLKNLLSILLYIGYLIYFKDYLTGFILSCILLLYIISRYIDIFRNLKKILSLEILKKNLFKLLCILFFIFLIYCYYFLKKLSIIMIALPFIILLFLEEIIDLLLYTFEFERKKAIICIERVFKKNDIKIREDYLKAIIDGESNIFENKSFEILKIEKNPITITIFTGMVVTSADNLLSSMKSDMKSEKDIYNVFFIFLYIFFASGIISYGLKIISILENKNKSIYLEILNDLYLRKYIERSQNNSKSSRTQENI